MAKLNSRHYTSNSTFVVPSGITKIMLLGHGGGGGGAGGRGISGGNQLGVGGGDGGMGTTPYLVEVNVVPGRTYNVTIGGGGSGGGSRNGGAGAIDSLHNGGAGGNTTFVDSTNAAVIHSFMGAQPYNTSNASPPTADVGHVVQLYSHSSQANNGSSGFVHITIPAPTTAGSPAWWGGFSGLAGWIGSAGGTGGNPTVGGTGGSGGNGSGYGAGGGGGGQGTTSAGGTGGSGTQGQLWVIWVD